MSNRCRDLMLAAFLGAALMLGGGTVRAEPEIGSVFQRNFMGATGTRIGGASEYLYFNTAVYAEETVSTEGGGSTALRFADGTRLQVGANSAVVLDRFVYDPDAGAGAAALSFSKGIFRYISGELGGDAVRLETPSATLAIRGTRFILAVDAAGSTDVWVIDGAVEAFPREGASATARAGQSLQVTAGVPGVVVVDGRTAPRDPAVEADLSFAGRRGDGDRERNVGTGSTGRAAGGGSNNPN